MEANIREPDPISLMGKGLGILRHSVFTGGLQGAERPASQKRKPRAMPQGKNFTDSNTASQMPQNGGEKEGKEKREG